MFGFRSVDPRLLEKSRIELYSLPFKQNKIDFLNECDQVTLKLLEDKISEYKSITNTRVETLNNLNSKYQDFVLHMAKIENDIVINTENKSNELDKVKNADVDLANFKQKILDKTNISEDIKTENNQ